MEDTLNHTKMEFIALSFFSALLIYALFCEASSDSILNMINTQEVEKYLAQRRENSTKEKRLLLFHNALEDGEVSSSSATHGNTFPTTTERFIKPYVPPMHHFTTRRENTRNMQPFDTQTVGIDVLMRKYNESFPYQSTDLLSDLSGYRGNKLLKSSKNALLVTTKNYLKADWCKTEPLVQKIRENGCLTRTVINRFCYGQCNSFYIPKNPRRSRSHMDYNNDEKEQFGDIREVAAAFKSCAFCKPKKASWITVTLFCPSMKQQRLRKRIQRIKQCKCISVDYN